MRIRFIVITQSVHHSVGYIESGKMYEYTVTCQSLSTVVAKPRSRFGGATNDTPPLKAAKREINDNISSIE